jgi:DNA-directed RNA polymerase subunit delta
LDSHTLGTSSDTVSKIKPLFHGKSTAYLDEDELDDELEDLEELEDDVLDAEEEEELDDDVLDSEDDEDDELELDSED